MAALFFFQPLAKAQLVTEDFSYTASTTLLNNGYTALSGSGTNNLTVAASGTGLSYASCSSARECKGSDWNGRRSPFPKMLYL